jgi:hypothetical protein
MSFDDWCCFSRRCVLVIKVEVKYPTLVINELEDLVFADLDRKPAVLLGVIGRVIFFCLTRGGHRDDSTGNDTCRKQERAGARSQHLRLR